MDALTNGVPLGVLFLSAAGLWLLAEGLAYALAPDSMKRFLDWASRLPVQDVRSSGIWSAILGLVLLYVGLRLA